VVPVLHRKERRAGLKTAKRAGLLISKKLASKFIQGTKISPLRDAPVEMTIRYLLNPASALMVNATITVLNIKAIKLCNSESLLIFRSEISTSETWKVMPSTKEK
jgi:hypothetical protein